MIRQGSNRVMNDFALEFDHLGLATSSPEKAVAFLRGLGYRCGSSLYDPLQRVNLVLCESDAMPAVEVISPSGETGPLDRLIASHGDIAYHLCYRARDVQASLAALKQAGHRVIEVAEMQPAVLFGNRKVGFYFVKGWFDRNQRCGKLGYWRCNDVRFFHGCPDERADRNAFGGEPDRR